LQSRDFVCFVFSSWHSFSGQSVADDRVCQDRGRLRVCSA
jgi:hypothetical protein